MTEFRTELEHAINRCSRENGSDTPDFILADYLANCLDAFDKATRWREKWYSPNGVPENERDNGPQPPYGRIASVQVATPANPGDPTCL